MKGRIILKLNTNWLQILCLLLYGPSGWKFLRRHVRKLLWSDRNIIKTRTNSQKHWCHKWNLCFWHKMQAHYKLGCTCGDMMVKCLSTPYPVLVLHTWMRHACAHRCSVLGNQDRLEMGTVGLPWSFLPTIFILLYLIFWQWANSQILMICFLGQDAPANMCCKKSSRRCASENKRGRCSTAPIWQSKWRNS